MSRIAYWNYVPFPYMTDRFNAVATRGTLEFEAWFNAAGVPHYESWTNDSSEWKFAHRYIPSVRIGGQNVGVPPAFLFRQLPDLVISPYGTPSFILGAATARLRGARTAFWLVHTFDSWLPRKRVREMIKRVVLPRADAILTTGADGRAFALHYGVNPERLYVLPHSIGAEFFDAQARTTAMGQRGHTRAELGLRGVTFLYVGRLWEGKGLGDLVTAFSLVQRHAQVEVSLLVVGNGAEEATLLRRCQEERLENVILTGFKQPSQTLPLYAAADVFVFPTLGDPYGLVVDEAMSFGLPPISTSSAGEIRDRIDHGKSGFIVPPQSAATLAERMVQLATDGQLRAEMGRCAAASVQDKTPDRWATDLERLTERILSTPRAREDRP